MAIMRSTDFRSIVEPILSEEFNGIYDQRADEWKKIFKEATGTPRAYHEEPVMYGFGAAPELPDGTAVTYETGGILFIQRYTYKVYGLAFALTKVLVEDGDHIKLGQTFSRHLAQSLVETKETLCANVVNRAFNSSYAGGDGVALINTAHPIVGSSFSNRLATDSALSHTSLEQMMIQIRNAVDNNGKRIRLAPKKLVVPPALQYQADRILNSEKQSGTANNDKNTLKGALEIADISRLTSQTAWFIQTDASEGMKMMVRRKVEKGMEGDFETDSMRYKATERYGVGFTDPRCLFGTVGA